LKPAPLRPQALADLQAEVQDDRREAGHPVAQRQVTAATPALNQLERQPAMASPVLGERQNLAALLAMLPGADLDLD
jgi:hypothetical protein